MSLDSSRLAIGNALVALLATIQNPTTSLPLYGFTKLGAVYDPSAYTTWAEVVHFMGQGGPAGSGGQQVGWRIDEAVRFMVTSGVGPYEIDSTAAETSLLTIQDALLPTIRKHFQLPNANNITQAVQSVYSVLVEQPDRSRPPAKFPNGHTYKLWDTFITVRQQYNVELIQP